MDPAQLPLRDIHLPEAIGWWPPAPGWWLLAILAVVIVSLLVQRWRRDQALRNSTAYLAHRELKQIEAAWQEHGNAQHLTQDISTWLRRVAMSLGTRQQAASLTGEHWWHYLDELAGAGIFSNGGGRLIADAPYQADAQVDAGELIRLCNRWVESLLQARQGGRK
ncbi:MAG: DUF4381 domain-containing protein [Gammaproteobacteria bacterium]|nr:DUF4381 domain-containing protein [Gammaproteobacteria bacterium]